MKATTMAVAPDTADAKVESGNITDADADIACNQGDAALLSRYLLSGRKPPAHAVDAIRRCLLAGMGLVVLQQGEWSLNFSTRNGRPRKERQAILESLIKRLSTADPSKKVLGQIAAMLKPTGESRWQLKFNRGRGFPRSPVNESMQLAYLGQRAIELLGADVSWEEVCRQLRDPKLSVSERRIKLGIQLVIKANAAKPS